MPTGKSWNLTDKRKEQVIYFLQRQYNINLLAQHFGICRQTMSKALTEMGIDVDELQKDGVRKMRTNLYATIDDIDDPKDKAKAQLDFLKQYDKSDDVAIQQQQVIIQANF
jgi:outer membrane lipopolysaccharide assembly protein LptE/RlpB